MDALDVFYPERMASRILGMGDVVSLVERAQEQFDEEQAKRLEKRIKKDQFDFNDFLEQIGQIKKMGSMKDLMGMLPGMGQLKNVDVNDDAFKYVEAIIHSMTPAERSNPSMINPSRKARIAKGCGRPLEEVNKLMKQFDQTRQMMKMFTNKSQMAAMMKQANQMNGMKR
jgi:signal recognition particle subunit SRP54